MQDLTLVGMHDDGERLLLSTAGGDRFTLAVDDALRAAVRGDRSRLGQIQLETERMRPRDIQARIRSGQTAAGDVPLDYVRRYEGAVLAERGYVAGQARKVQIRRGALAAATTPTLGDLVDERLRRREVDPGLSSWDAWRGDDGTWTVQVDFPVGAKRRQARWVYNPPLKQVTPLDDESRWLTDGDGRDRESRPARNKREDSSNNANANADSGSRRLAVAPIPSLRGFDDAEVVAEEKDLLDALVESESISAPSLELLDSLRERRGRRVRPVQDEEEGSEPDPVESAIESILAMRNAALPPDAPEEDGARPGPQRSTGRSSGRPATGRASATPQGGSSRNGSRHPAGKALHGDDARGPAGSEAPSAEPGGRSPSTPPVPRNPRPQQRTTQRTLEVPTPEPASSDVDGTTSADDEEGTATPSGRPAGTGRPTRKTRRASVPSWDEIILGARRD
jgi:hypothetical protein